MTLQQLIDYAVKHKISMETEVMLTEIDQYGFMHAGLDIEGYVDDGELKLTLVKKYQKYKID